MLCLAFLLHMSVTIPVVPTLLTLLNVLTLLTLITLLIRLTLLTLLTLNPINPTLLTLVHEFPPTYFPGAAQETTRQGSQGSQRDKNTKF
jgi:hypothetical protein